MNAILVETDHHDIVSLFIFVTHAREERRMEVEGEVKFGGSFAVDVAVEEEANLLIGLEEHVF